MIAIARGAPDTEPWPWLRGLAWLALLAPFFFASYGFANWVASQRAVVPAVVFDWERHIPFIAWTIIPYWSIDLLYGASLVLCRTRALLDAHVRRLFAAQLIAIACFLAFPLRVTFERPAIDGGLGWLFDVLASFDQPFNQAPSLHLALLVILWASYQSALAGQWRWGFDLLALLIGASVLTTGQHHFIDVPTGVWLGWFCVWLFPVASRAPLTARKFIADRARHRLALCYAACAAFLTATALALGGTGLWLLWVAAALGLVAAIYWRGHACSFQKARGGSLPPATLWLLSPYILGAWLNSRWWTRATPRADEVWPGVMLGRLPTAAQIRMARVAAVVDVCAELPCRSASVRYVSVPMLDLVAPYPEQIERASIAIEELREDGSVLVCCALGFTRSALVVAAWLVRTRHAESIDAAITLVRRARPAVVIAGPQRAALAQWAAQYMNQARPAS